MSQKKAWDLTSLRSLEVLRTIRSNAVAGSLAGAIDETADAIWKEVVKAFNL